MKKEERYSEQELAAYVEWGWYEESKYGSRSPGCEYIDCSEPCCSGVQDEYDDAPDFCPYTTCPLMAKRLIDRLGYYKKTN